jgi:hypothetical protein
MELVCGKGSKGKALRVDLADLFEDSTERDYVRSSFITAVQ